MNQPVAGVRVLEVATHMFVPVAGAVLAEWGAEVLKVEHPETGDPYRGLVTLGLHASYGAVGSLNFQYANRGKQSIGIDLKIDAGRELLYRFAAGADVFMTNLLPATRAALGIDVDDIRACNASIVYVRGSGQGQNGPHADRGGYDIAAYWSRSGIADLMQGESQYPPFPPPAFGDLAGGLAVAGAVAAALYKRAMGGEPSVIDVSLLSVGMWQIQPDIVDATISGQETRKPQRDRYATWNPLVEQYRTRDGRLIALVMVDADRHWAELCRVIGAPELADDPRFVDLDARRTNCRACVGQLEAIFAGRDYDDWCHTLETFSGAWSPVQRPGELVDDPQVIANGYIAAADLGDGDSIPMVTLPFQFDGTHAIPRRAPEHGEHTESSLLALGLSWDEIGDLKRQGAIL